MRDREPDHRRLLARLHRAEERAATAEARCLETERRWLDDDRFDVAADLFAGFVHEARSPLGALLCNLGLASDLVATASLDGELPAIIEDSRHACRAIERALHRLRACSDMTAPLCLTPLSPLVETAGVLVRRRLSARGVRLVLDIDGAPSGLGTPGGICRILFGLLANAADASPLGATVSVALRTKDDRVVVSVRAGGRSVAPAEADEVFAPLDERMAPRSGIRLAVARGLAEQQGGQLRVEALPPGEPGSCFCLELLSARPSARSDQHRGGSRAG